MSDKTYDDIINLPRPISKNHPPMAPEKRAAQFAPFAPLVGFMSMRENKEENMRKETAPQSEFQSEYEDISAGEYQGAYEDAYGEEFSCNSDEFGI